MVRKLTTLFALIGLISCVSQDKSPTTAIDSYPVSISMGSYTTAGLSNFLIPSAYASVSDLKLCFKRMRFKKDITDVDDPTVDENIDLNFGEVTLSSAGTSLGVVNIPADTYYRIEFDLEPSCAGKSMVLSNDFGTYSSTEGMKIKFDGVFVVDGTENLQLGVQDILNAANGYSGPGSLKTAMESVSGDL